MASSAATFRLSDYDIVVFDMNESLIGYKLDKVLPLIYHAVCGRMIATGRYTMATFLPYDIDFVMQGLFADLKRCKLLKLSVGGIVSKVYDGTTRLPNSKVKEIYGEDRMIKPGDGTEFRVAYDIIQTVWFLTYARLCNSGHCNEDDVESTTKTLEDLDDAVDRVTNFTHYDDDNEWLQELRTDPKKYVHEIDPDVISWLSTLKKSARKIGLSTGSRACLDYTDFIMKSAISSDWRKYFDFVSCPAAGEENSSAEDPPNLEELARNAIDQNEKSLRYLYIGQRLTNDVISSDRQDRWDRIVISKDQESEGIMGLNSYYPYRKEVSSTVWGSLFYDDRGKSSYWLEMIQKHCKLVVPSLSYFCCISIDEVVPAFDPTNRKTFGFYPKVYVE